MHASVCHESHTCHRVLWHVSLSVTQHRVCHATGCSMPTDAMARKREPCCSSAVRVMLYIRSCTFVGLCFFRRDRRLRMSCSRHLFVVARQACRANTTASENPKTSLRDEKDTLFAPTSSNLPTLATALRSTIQRPASYRPPSYHLHKSMPIGTWTLPNVEVSRSPGRNSCVDQAVSQSKLDTQDPTTIPTTDLRAHTGERTR